jgi:Flp pilus assembly protein TadB
MMRRRRQHFAVSDAREAQSTRLRRRRHWYFVLMGICLALIVLAWNVVRLWSTSAALAMSAVAAVLPPVAVLIANWGEDH